MNDDPLHRCVSGLRCLARGTESAAAVSKRDAFCITCLTSLQRCMDDLPAMAIGLRAFVAVPIAGKGGEKVGGSKEPPTPLNVRVVDLINDIGLVMDWVGSTPLRDIVSQSDGLAWAKDVRDLHAQADKIIGLSPTWRNFAAPCPVCSTFTLGGWQGSDSVHCVSCGTVTTLEEYRTNNIIQVKER